MHALSTILENGIRHYGLLAVFIAMVLESACIPLPSELIMTYAGYEAYRGNIGFASAVVVGIAGNVIGSMLAYYVGSLGGRPLLRRYGKYILFSEKHFASAERFFDRAGVWAVLVSRILPAIRTFISLPAGIANMNRRKFVLFTTIGCIPWVWLLAYVGYALGQHWEQISAHSGGLSVLFAVILITAVVWFWLSNRQQAATRKR